MAPYQARLWHGQHGQHDQKAWFSRVSQAISFIQALPGLILKCSPQLVVEMLARQGAWAQLPHDLLQRAAGLLDM